MVEPLKYSVVCLSSALDEWLGILVSLLFNLPCYSHFVYSLH